MKYKLFSAASGDVGGDHAPARRFLGLGSAIHIYNISRTSLQHYATTIHETAHASHWNMSSGGDYTNSADFVSESWARGVEFALTNMVYPNYQPVYGRLSYTGIVEDLMDGIGTTVTEFYFSGGWITSQRIFPDNVEGYTIRQIEDALLGQRTQQDWSNRLVALFNNPTEENVPALFTSVMSI